MQETPGTHLCFLTRHLWRGYSLFVACFKLYSFVSLCSAYPFCISFVSMFYILYLFCIHILYFVSISCNSIYFVTICSSWRWCQSMTVFTRFTSSLGGNFRQTPQSMRRIDRFPSVARPEGTSATRQPIIRKCSSFCRQLIDLGMESTVSQCPMFNTRRFTNLLMSEVNSSKAHPYATPSMSLKPVVTR